MCPVVSLEKRTLQGSPSRDIFKRLHKEHMPSNFYACDMDFILVTKFPFGIVAFLDYKSRRDHVQFSEVIAFNTLIQWRRLFIIFGKDAERGPFSIFEYKGGDPGPEPPIVDLVLIRQCDTWADLSEWEGELRNDNGRQYG